MTTDTERHLLCEFAFDGCEQNHILSDWRVEFTVWTDEGLHVKRSLRVEAGCGYAAEEAAMDYARDHDEEFDRMLDLRGA